MVGALVVDDEGVIVGRGAHQFAGGPHAEVVALQDAGARARGATLYCTLEPCSHTGRTGPCAPLVTGAGVRRAVIAIEDPNPLVHGAGLRHLRERGVAVDVGVESDAAIRQNAVFLTNIHKRRPHVTLKVALSVDGRVGLPGERALLTGAPANRRTQRQRAEIDAVAVGSGTVLADDPQLTPRGAYRDRPLTRAILDRRLRTPPAARVFSTLDAGPVIIITSDDAASSDPSRVDALVARGARVAALPDAGIGPALRILWDEGVRSLVVEGGTTVHRAALQAGVVDAVHMFIAPRRLGYDAVPWIGGGLIAWEGLRDRRAKWLGADLFVEGLV
jgi:diaminohydroxyphosphoribosylaminopyrimidine deaminase/5-amino-6-(5-phosphoribosylamino)uracil reductase